MQLDWTTFVLEIVNFLILVWILKRFLYQPVLQAITRRKTVIEQTLAEATREKTDAQALEQQYRTRLDTWEQEKAQLREQMLGEVRTEREQHFAELENALAREREKNRVLDERRLQDLERKLSDDAKGEGAAFVARLLSRLATPALETRLVEVAIEDLQQLSDRQRRPISSAVADANVTLKVTTSYLLPEEQRQRFEQALNRAAGKVVKPEYTQDAKLLAGLRACVGPWILQANLQDELSFFAEAIRHGDAD
ncbi:MAG: F0F1 ATP synthase subunit delta [Betaproteobacteria bacterium]|nr:F0F1 ATP synthase subunit delta [Gammaproteobacteria bacterium]MDH3435963.1 F0F1 ATP synthase subunit delta [Betaproteobacteria bacterium]